MYAYNSSVFCDVHYYCSRARQDGHWEKYIYLYASPSRELVAIEKTAYNIKATVLYYRFVCRAHGRLWIEFLYEPFIRQRSLSLYTFFFFLVIKTYKENGKCVTHIYISSPFVGWYRNSEMHNTQDVRTGSLGIVPTIIWSNYTKPRIVFKLK